MWKHEMKKFNWLSAQLALLLCLAMMPAINAIAKDIPVYKGMLSVSIVDDGEGSSLLLQYLTKTRQVLRVGVRGLVMINNRTHRVLRLPDASASIAPGQVAGYLHADIDYDELELAGDDYRVEGSLTVYLAGYQQSRSFTVYLRQDAPGRPANSSIDWGIHDPAR